MAAIAPSDIAAGSGAVHKPHDKAAGKTDVSSPFQQILDAVDAGQVQDDQDTPDAGKAAAKDFKHALQADQILATTNDNALGDIAAVTQASGQDSAMNDPGKSDATTGNAASDPAGQTDQKPGWTSQQTAPDPSQILAATQVPPSSQASDQTASNAEAALTSEIEAQNAATEPAASDQPNTSDPAADSPKTVVDSSAVSKSGKIKDAGKEAAVDPSLTDPLPPQSDAPAPSSSAPKPATGKDAKSGKTQNDPQGNDNKLAADQAATVNPLAVAGVMPLPTQTPPAPASDGDAIAAAAASGATKGAAKSAKPGPSPTPAPDNGAEPAKTTDGKPLPSNGPLAAAQNSMGTPAGSDGAKNDNKPQTAASTSDKPTTSPAQPQSQLQSQPPQAAPPQTQPQGVIPPVQLASQAQTHAGATASVAQNVQVGPQDNSATANTVGALAVAIAAKSQSGNKQFDIRLDPPELGRVEVRLSIDASGKAQASLSADQPRTLDMLKTDAPVLTRALRDAGLNVAQNGLNFSLRGQDRQNGNSGGFTPRSGRGSRVSLTAISTIGAVQGAANYQGPADGRLDIRV